MGDRSDTKSVILNWLKLFSGIDKLDVFIDDVFISDVFNVLYLL